MSKSCPRCAGCGQIASDGTPWKYWIELPPVSQTAIVFGIVSRQTCPDCGGTGTAPEKPVHHDTHVSTDAGFEPITYPTAYSVGDLLTYTEIFCEARVEFAVRVIAVLSTELVVRTCSPHPPYEPGNIQATVPISACEKREPNPEHVGLPPLLRAILEAGEPAEDEEGEDEPAEET